MAESKNGWRASLLHPFFGRYRHREDIPLKNVSASINDECLIFGSKSGLFRLVLA
jgi:hypothetical protein